MKAIYEPKGKAKEYAELAVNLYSGCPHKCLYCFAPKIAHKKPGDFHRNVKVRDKIIEKIDHDCIELAGLEQPPILLCFICDPYPHGYETTVTRQAIETIKRYELNFTVLTKAGEAAERDFDLYEDGDSFGCTLTLASSWESEAGSHYGRVMALFHAQERGIQTWASLEPVIYPKRTLRIIERTAPFVDHYKLGKLNYHPHAKTIDWADFTKRAVELLESLSKSYYVKESLREYLPEVNGE